MQFQPRRSRIRHCGRVCFGGLDRRGGEVAASRRSGACGAYGYGFDYSKVADARVAAMSKCSRQRLQDRWRRVPRRAAVAVDAKHPCGSFGWAITLHLRLPKMPHCSAAMSSAAKNAWSAPSPAMKSGLNGRRRRSYDADKFRFNRINPRAAGAYCAARGKRALSGAS